MTELNVKECISISKYYMQLVDTSEVKTPQTIQNYNIKKNLKHETTNSSTSFLQVDYKISTSHIIHILTKKQLLP